MSTIQEIIQEENANTRNIILHKEGIFYKAYQQSAFAWVKYICNYEVKCKYVKSVGRNILSIGFPVRSLETKLEGRTFETLDSQKIVVKLQEHETIEKHIYEQWSNEFSDSGIVADTPIQYAKSDRNEDLLSEILAFPIETSSPIECMMFLSELKRKYNK